MDEADLTFHPEWQRQLIQILTAFLPLEYGACGVTDIQALLTTHSPLLLGDIPPNNVSFLRTAVNPENKTAQNTFGQNIHTILKSSFFLQNGVGEFARAKINKTAETLRKMIRGDVDKTPEKLAACKAVIDLVSHGIIKNKLLELYDEATGNDNQTVETIRGTIGTLHTDQIEYMIRVFQDEIERRKQ